MIDFRHEGTARATEASLRPILHRLIPYRGVLERTLAKGSYDIPESSIGLPFDREHRERIHNVVNMMGVQRLKFVILIGIGGSSLGTQAIYDLFHGFYDRLEPLRFPKAFFLDTVYQPTIDRLISLINEEISNEREIAIVVVSRSGATLETHVNTEALWNAFSKRWPHLNSRFVAVSRPGTKLWELAIERQWHTIEIPLIVSGRFSAFSANHLVPLAMLGFEVNDLVRGAREAVNHALGGDLHNNVAAVSAAVRYFHVKRGTDVNQLFVFNPAFEIIGKWWRQLTAESLGKEGKGILPVVSLGSNDLHSVAQYDLDGPNRTLTTFVETGEITPDGKPTILHSLMEAAEIGYRGRKRPFMTLKLRSLDLMSVGYLMQTWMIETMYLAHLMDVDAFSQPAVEIYKKEIRHEFPS